MWFFRWFKMGLGFSHRKCPLWWRVWDPARTCPRFVIPNRQTLRLSFDGVRQTLGVVCCCHLLVGWWASPAQRGARAHCTAEIGCKCAVPARSAVKTGECPSATGLSRNLVRHLLMNRLWWGNPITFWYVPGNVRTPPTEHQPAVLDSDAEILRHVHYISKHYLPGKRIHRKGA